MPSRFFQHRLWHVYFLSERAHHWFYESLLHIRAWKSLLPDAGGWFVGGFAKQELKSRQPDYLRQFLEETCRGEWSHFIVMIFAPLFFLFNPPWAGWVMLAYGLLANLPCILVQRYNRRRLAAVIR